MKNLYKKIGERKFFCIALVLCYYSVFLLRYHQIVRPNGKWPSDLGSHINFSLVKLGEGYAFDYSLTFALIRWIYQYKHFDVIFAAILASSTILTIIILYCQLKNDNCKTNILGLTRAEILAICLAFVSMLFLPGISEKAYLGKSSPNIWHNTTYTLMQPLALLTFIVYGEILENVAINWKKYIAFSILCLITTLLKPSFVFVFFIAIFIFAMIDLLKEKDEWKKKLIKYILLAGTCIPTLAVLGWQYISLFGRSDNTGIGISFGTAWGMYSECIIKDIACLLAYPIVIAFLYGLKINNKRLVLSWMMVFVAIIEVLFFTETGSRAAAFNFSWGYAISAFLLFVETCRFQLVNCENKQKDMLNMDVKYKKGKKHNKKELESIMFIDKIGWWCFSLHVFCGIFYFINIFCGNSYI